MVNAMHRRTSLILILTAAALFGAAPAAACTRASVYFGWGSAEVSAEGRAALEQLALALAWQGPNLHHILLTSRTDTSGSPAANLALAQRRAEAVKAVLLANEVPARLIEIAALGEAGVPRTVPQNVRDPRLRRVDLLMQLKAEAQARQLEEGQPIC